MIYPFLTQSDKSYRCATIFMICYECHLWTCESHLFAISCRHLTSLKLIQKMYRFSIAFGHNPPPHSTTTSPTTSKRASIAPSRCCWARRTTSPPTSGRRRAWRSRCAPATICSIRTAATGTRATRTIWRTSWSCSAWSRWRWSGAASTAPSTSRSTVSVDDCLWNHFAAADQGYLVISITEAFRLKITIAEKY